MAKQYDTFDEFWPFYVLEHAQAGTRILHFIGTSLLLTCLFAIFFVGSFWFLFLGVLFAYGCAWAGHFLVEKNRPATFKYPFFSLAGDFKMYCLMLTGRMTQEVERCKLHRRKLHKKGTASRSLRS
jgi:hypothetical protein